MDGDTMKDLLVQADSGVLVTIDLDLNDVDDLDALYWVLSEQFDFVRVTP